MKEYTRFTFHFRNPVICYGDPILEDDILATDLREALRILRKEYYHARIYKVMESKVQLYDKTYQYTACPTTEVHHSAVSKAIAELAESSDIPSA